jgi:hypothetical protein
MYHRSTVTPDLGQGPESMARGPLIISSLQLHSAASNWSINPPSVKVPSQFTDMALSRRRKSRTELSVVQLPLIPAKLRAESFNHIPQSPGVQPRSAARQRRTQMSPKVRMSKVGCSQPQTHCESQEFALVSSKKPKRAVF